MEYYIVEQGSMIIQHHAGRRNAGYMKKFKSIVFKFYKLCPTKNNFFFKNSTRRLVLLYSFFFIFIESLPFSCVLCIIIKGIYIEFVVLQEYFHLHSRNTDIISTGCIFIPVVTVSTIKLQLYKPGG